ncbi:unnamed protein product [Prorocentrum cordatum]|uniref:Uncharacterized protein n=1 Tax=Prorocentrum cordatum TaxID=2364126 RepID=A0ABN9W3R4_9DINO|nr:unnamed protein product [Polarella glacialis]
MVTYSFQRESISSDASRPVVACDGTRLLGDLFGSRPFNCRGGWGGWTTKRVRSRWGGSEEPASLHKSMGSLAAAWRRPRSRGRAIGRTPPDCDRAADDSSLLTETMAFAGRA